MGVLRSISVVLMALLCGMANGGSLSYEGLADLRGPYDGTDWLGRAFHAVRLGMAGRLPVYACWSSAADAKSPWFGRGWRLPLVESRVFPIGEKTLELHLPDGYVRYFHKGRDGRYVGGRFWVAERDQDEIRVTADTKDGYPKSVFVFLRGRLAKMECEEGVYEFRHDARNGDTVLCRGRTVLSVRPESGDPQAVRLEVGGVRIAVRKQSVRLLLPPTDPSSSPMPGEESCLTELCFADGSRRTFAYGEDGSLARFATEGETLLWDPASRKIVSHNDSRFTVGRRPNDMSGPKIERTDAEGNRVSFFRDRRQGVTEEELPDGRKIVTRRFTSGDNAGRVRWREFFADGVMQKRVDYIYGADGSVCDKLVRTECK